MGVTYERSNGCLCGGGSCLCVGGGEEGFFFSLSFSKKRVEGGRRKLRVMDAGVVAPSVLSFSLPLVFLCMLCL